MKVFVLQAQGFGDNEFEFYNIGVFSNKVDAEQAQRNCIAEGLEDDMEIVTKIETWDML